MLGRVLPKQAVVYLDVSMVLGWFEVVRAPQRSEIDTLVCFPGCSICVVGPEQIVGDVYT